MNKTIIAIVIVAVVVLGGYFLLRSGEKVLLPPGSTYQSKTSAPKTTIAEKNMVTYTDSGYSLATLQVKKGETVTFKNQSSQSMWTASAAHPTHRVYPTTGGCLGSTFDSCKGFQPGDSWSFKFDIAGTWKYHNHLDPSDNGTIYVSN